MKSNRAALGWLVGIAALSILACTEPPEPSPPNLLLISIDTLRADHLGCYGYARDTSPFIDSLAERGVRFERAFAQASWTLPSHMSLMTSLHPRSHRVETHEQALPASIPTLAQILDQAGYHTTAFVNWIYLKAAFGFGRGFDEFYEVIPTAEPPTAGHALDVVGPLESWESSDRPFFLFLHLFNPHMSYEPPLEDAQRFDPALEDVSGGAYDELSRYIRGLHGPDTPPIPDEVIAEARALYDGEIFHTDRLLAQIFEILEARGMLENTLIVLTSDHGEEFGEHLSMEGHQWTLYDEVLRVPLIVVFPGGGHAGREIGRTVRQIDVAPTVLDLLGLSTPPSFEGRSLLPLLGEGEDVPWEETVYSHIRRFNIKASVRTPEWKLIYTRDTGKNLFDQPIEPGFELYDLRHDPEEQHDIYEPEDPTARELAAKLQAFFAQAPEIEAGEEIELSPEELEQLRSLGYIR